MQAVQRTGGVGREIKRVDALRLAVKGGEMTQASQRRVGLQPSGRRHQRGVKQTPEQRARLLTFVAESTKQTSRCESAAELTGRTQAAVRRALDQVGIQRRRSELAGRRG